MIGFEYGEMIGFEYGEMIDVRNSEGDKWEPRMFVIKHAGAYWCEHRSISNRINPWIYAQAIPKPERIDYTADTFPKGLVWVRLIGVKGMYMVIQVESSYISLRHTSIFYEALANEYEISTDSCKTWQPASQEVVT